MSLYRSKAQLPLRKFKAFRELRRLLTDVDGWMVGGSFAQNTEDYNDIDLYFRTESEYEAAVAIFNRATKDDTFGKVLASERNATTYYALAIDVVPVQLVRCCFGRPEDIINSVDLNICKQVVLPSGHRLMDASAKLRPFAVSSIKNTTSATPIRLLKYLKRYGYKLTAHEKVEHIKTFIDTYIDSDHEVIDYYTIEGTKVCFNQALYRQLEEEFSEYPKLDVSITPPRTVSSLSAPPESVALLEYLRKKAAEKAPELLI